MGWFGTRRMLSGVLVEFKKTTQTDFISAATRGPVCLSLCLMRVCVFVSAHSEGSDTDGAFLLTH